ncbi:MULTISPECIES: fructokinase ScrK [Enterococcus]|uniref:fructokinase ScrK n=1 Tax=Enterococcus TaxID=1350 RepID=UPI0003302018|nr:MULTISPECIES: fructokinase ScrK [Enterococcus]EGP5570178.1 ROK family protein [Enterococcus faecium]EME8172121.1 ROK family protein [Enterococcus faecium]EMF0197899.1 ROK family protein [Enterococcus hirae]EOH38175.1 fructokinase [Enterococcus faecium EnGen0185]EOH46503.1 fructokinase [Enterococcus faecium EnGen0190]
MYGSIEAGGTKFVCAIGNDDLEIIERVSFPTTTSDETMSLVINFFNQYKEQLESIGVGSFGPIDIHRESKTYGYITSTPKIGWENFDFVGTLKRHFEIPIAWTTDVNAACYGEYVSGYGKGLSSVVYYTIGTGVGGGAIQDGIFVEGFSHPEMGHMLIKRHSEDTFSGNCPFHHDCLEGMASGPTIEMRTGTKGQDLSIEDPIWKIEADYIAQCAYNTTLMFSPDIIIFGGGVMQQEHLKKKVQRRFLELINGYVDMPNIEEYIVTPKLADNAGTIGCLTLAKDVRFNS